MKAGGVGAGGQGGGGDVGGRGGGGSVKDLFASVRDGRLWHSVLSPGSSPPKGRVLTLAERTVGLQACTGHLAGRAPQASHQRLLHSSDSFVD